MSRDPSNQSSFNDKQGIEVSILYESKDIQLLLMMASHHDVVMLEIICLSGYLALSITVLASLYWFVPFVSAHGRTVRTYHL